VIAIEPQARLVAMIRESAALSGAGSCEVMQVACGGEMKTLDLIVPSDDSGRAGFYEGFSGRHKHKTEPVNVVTLNSLDLESVSLIKIDVEGSELAVIAGAVDTIDRLRPPILIELNPWSARAANTSTDSIVEQLVSLGYNQFGLADSYPVTIDAAGIPRDRQINLIAQRVAKQQSSR
jgi:FkbM family methyltransferase